MARLDTLELEIVQKSKNVSTKEIDRLATALNNLALSANKAEDIKHISEALSGLVTASNNASKVPGTIKRIGDALKTLLTTITDADNAVAALDRVAAAIARIGEAGQSLSGVSSEIRAVSKAVNSASAIDAGNPQANIVPSNAPATETGVEEVAEQASRATVELNLASRAVKAFGESVENACRVGVVSVKGLVKGFKGLYSIGWSVAKLPLSKLGSSISGLAGKVKNLFSSFKRIAMYRALRTAIKAITQGFSEGIKHLYQWSQLTGNTFKNSMDSLATSAHYLRDSLGAMASPIIDALAPAIDALVEKFVTLLNLVNQFASALTGKDTWRKAIKTPTTYSGAMEEAAKSTKKATKAQKELNKALQGFDELNLLTTSEIKARKPTASNSDKPEVSEGEFEVVEVADWIQDIKGKINAGQWYEAGNALAEKLNSIVDSWDSEAWGRELGTKVEHGLKFFLGFMENTKWNNMGVKVAGAFNGFFSGIDSKDLGNAMIAPIKAAIGFLNGFFNGDAEHDGIDLSPLAEALSTAINGLFDEDFVKEVGETIGGAFQAINKAIHTLLFGDERWVFNPEVGYEVKVGAPGIDFSAIGRGFVEAIITAIKNVDWEMAGENLAKLGTGIIDAIISGIEYAVTHIGELAQAIADFAKGFFKELFTWFWPSVKEFLFGGEYTTDANDRPNAPLSTGQGANTPEEFEQVLQDTGEGLASAWNWTTTTGLDKLKEGWEWLSDHASINLDVTDTKGTINAQDKSVQGLNKDLDHTDGTFTSTFKTKDLNAKQKAIVPYANMLDGIDGSMTSKFKTKDLGDKKKSVTPYWTKVTSLDGTFTSKFKTSGLSDVNKAVSETQTAIDNLTKQKDIKIKMTVEAIGTASGKEVVVHNYFGTGLTAHAEGGFPKQGSLFLAGEVPGDTELLGTINGKTGVASGKEITGIADAVYTTGDNEAQLLREQNQLLRQLLAKKTDVNLAPNVAAGRWVAQAQSAYARATGG